MVDAIIDGKVGIKNRIVLQRISASLIRYNHLFFDTLLFQDG